MSAPCNSLFCQNILLNYTNSFSFLQFSHNIYGIFINTSVNFLSFFVNFCILSRLYYKVIIPKSTKKGNSMELSQQIIQNNENLKADLISFIKLYGVSGLQEAMQLYTEACQNYICKTKASVRKIKIMDIYYLKIHGHKITVHTANDTYNKYGTLHKELALLSAYGFLKCSQSCIVSLRRIREIENNTLTLTNGDRLHISRTCTAKILTAFNRTSVTFYPEKD